MRTHVHKAVVQRDERLARIRKLSLWITGGAAAVSLGLGTAFAHALPGHTATTSSTTGTVHHGSASGSSGSSGTSGSGKAGRQHRHRLSRPAHKPAAAQPTQTQAPVVSSGGS